MAAAPYLKKAALAIGLPADQAELVGAYDFRHNGIQHNVDATGDLQGASALSGTSPKTISDRYLHPSERNARRTRGACWRRGPPNRARKPLVRLYTR